jgi:hypothetical protein
MLWESIKSQQIIFYSNNELYNVVSSPFPFSPVGDADALCADIRNVNYTGLSCVNTIPFLGYTTRSLTDLASLYGFSPTAAVVGPTGLSIGTWTDVLTGTLFGSMFGAGVLNNFNLEFFTGVTSTGTTSSNCADYSSSAAGSIITGDSSA